MCSAGSACETVGAAHTAGAATRYSNGIQAGRWTGRQGPYLIGPMNSSLSRSWVVLSREIARPLRRSTTPPRRLVYGFALRVLRDQTIAEEVAIEVYLQVYQQAACFDYRRSTPSAWLITLTRSRALDRRRQDAVRLQREASPAVVEQVACPLDPEAYSTALERHRAVQSALEASVRSSGRSLRWHTLRGLATAQSPPRWDSHWAR